MCAEFSEAWIREAVRLAYVLHPESEQRIAAELALRALEAALLESRAQRRSGRYKQEIPLPAKIQVFLYAASLEWERDQESPTPAKEPVYQPTADDLLIRYIKWLIAEVIHLRSVYAGVACGCLLWRYAPSAIVRLAPDYWPEDNIRRVKDRLVKALRERFQGRTDIFDNAQPGGLRTRPPVAHERGLVEEALRALAPWIEPHTAPAGPVLETYFGPNSQRSEWERTHVLIDPACVGLAGFVKEYRQAVGDDMDDPQESLLLPDFHPPPANAPSGGTRFTPAPVAPAILQTIRYSLSEHPRRRKRFWARAPLRVHVDGRPQLLFRDFCEFTASSSTTCVEIFGEDEQGELLLAAFLLSLDEADEGQQLTVTLEGRQQLDLQVVPGGGDDPITLRLTYHVPILATAAAYLAGLLPRLGVRWPRRGESVAQAAARSQSRRRDWGVSPWVQAWIPAVAVGLLLVLTFNVWIDQRVRGGWGDRSAEDTLRTRGGTAPGQDAAPTLASLIEQGRQYEREGKTPQAIAAYQKAVDQVALPLNQLAGLFLDQGEAARGLPLARLAVQLRPDDAYYLDTLAVILCQLGEAAEAVQTMEQAAQVDPQLFREKLDRFRRGACQ